MNDAAARENLPAIMDPVCDDHETVVNKLKCENLRGHVTGLELIFSMLGEAAKTEIARNRDAQGLPQNKQAAHSGGKVAGNARRELEKESGRKVATSENYLALTQAAKKVERLR